MSRQRGDHFERIALEHLKKQGCRIITTNYSWRGGEIDIIAKDQHYIAFIEVRYRRSSQFGSAAETVTYSKQQRIINTAKLYLQSRGLSNEFPLRFDVLTVGEGATITWIKNAFGN